MRGAIHPAFGAGQAPPARRFRSGSFPSQARGRSGFFDRCGVGRGCSGFFTVSGPTCLLRHLNLRAGCGLLSRGRCGVRAGSLPFGRGAAPSPAATALTLRCDSLFGRRYGLTDQWLQSLRDGLRPRGGAGVLCHPFGGRRLQAALFLVCRAPPPAPPAAARTARGGWLSLRTSGGSCTRIRPDLHRPRLLLPGWRECTRRAENLSLWLREGRRLSRLGRLRSGCHRGGRVASGCFRGGRFLATVAAVPPSTTPAPAPLALYSTVTRLIRPGGRNGVGVSRRGCLGVSVIFHHGNLSEGGDGATGARVSPLRSASVECGKRSLPR